MMVLPLRTRAASCLRVRAASSISLGRLGGLLRDAQSAEQLIAIHDQHATSFNQRQVASCWQRLGSCARSTPPADQRQIAARLKPLLDTTLDQLRWPNFGAPSVAATAVGAAKCGVGRQPPWDALWARLADRAVERMPDLQPHHLSMTVWALAKACGDGAPPALFAAVEAEAERRGLGEFDAQALSNLAWAAARAGAPVPHLFMQVAEEARRRRLAGFSPQAIANTVWAFSAAGEAARHPRFLAAAAAAAQAEGGLGAFKPHELSALAWAYAKAGPFLEAEVLPLVEEVQGLRGAESDAGHSARHSAP